MNSAEFLLLFTPWVLFACFWAIPFLGIPSIRHLLRGSLFLDFVILLTFYVFFIDQALIFVLPIQLIHFFVFYVT